MKRLDAYVRVSATRGREGERFTSPSDQEKAIRKWADLYGHAITNDGPDGDGAWHELDVSGGTMDRPKLNEILARVDAGESDGIVVYRLDRFGRTLIGALAIIERLHDTGKHFASVMDNFDIATENGRLVLRIMLSLAQYERERIQTTWRNARNNAVERGWHVSGERPFGYQREALVNSKGEPYFGKLIADPIEGPVVAEIFERRAAGEAWSTIAKWLRSTGVATSRGKTAWSVRALTTLVANPIYLGEARGAALDKAKRPMVRNTEAHDPLTDPATWEAANAVSARAPKRAGRGSSHDALGVGLVRCASCRYLTKVNVYANGGSKEEKTGLRYYCARTATNGDCPTPVTIPARRPTGLPGLDFVIEERILARLRRDPVGFLAFDDDDEVDLGELEAQLAAAVARSEAHGGDLDFEETHGVAAYEARGRRLKERVEAAKAALIEAKNRQGRRHQLGRSAREIVDDWENGRLSIDEKRTIVASMVQAVFVRPIGRDRDVRSAKAQAAYMDDLRGRAHLVWSDEDPVDVPRQGRRDWSPKVFEFPA